VGGFGGVGFGEVVVAGVVGESAVPPSRTPVLFRAMSSPETATMSPEIDPITLGVVLKNDASPPPESPSPDSSAGSISGTAEHMVDGSGSANVLLGADQAKLSYREDGHFSCDSAPGRSSLIQARLSDPSELPPDSVTRSGAVGGETIHERTLASGNHGRVAQSSPTSE
jgi:hypothetical protein